MVYRLFLLLTVLLTLSATVAPALAAEPASRAIQEVLADIRQQQGAARVEAINPDNSIETIGILVIRTGRQGRDEIHKNAERIPRSQEGGAQT